MVEKHSELTAAYMRAAGRRMDELIIMELVKRAEIFELELCALDRCHALKQVQSWVWASN